MNKHPYMMLLSAGIPVSVVLVGSAVSFARQRNLPSLLQLLGAGALMMVVLAHLAETFVLLPSMGWGLADSPGHYLDLGSAVLGLGLFPVGYLIDALRRFRGR
jgi:hypothetical protein